MTDPSEKANDKALHELMENEFQQLVDIIEQKQIVHEDLDFQAETPAAQVEHSAHRLLRQSQELGADTLAEFFTELEFSARNGGMRETRELLDNIQDEFEKVKDILSGK